MGDRLTVGLPARDETGLNDILRRALFGKRRVNGAEFTNLFDCVLADGDAVPGQVTADRAYGLPKPRRTVDEGRAVPAVDFSVDRVEDHFHFLILRLRADVKRQMGDFEDQVTVFAELFQAIFVRCEFLDGFGCITDVDGDRFVGRLVVDEANDRANAGVEQGDEDLVHLFRVGMTRMRTGKKLPGHYPVGPGVGWREFRFHFAILLKLERPRLPPTECPTI